MKDYYEIAFDERAAMLRITTDGFWSLAVTTMFSADLLARGTAIRIRHGSFCTLADLRRAPIQPLPVIDALSKMMPKALRLTSAPIAAVVGSSLAKLQTERYLVGPNCRTFLDYDEAEQWLSEASLAVRA